MKTALLFLLIPSLVHAAEPRFFGIQVIDAVTHRPVPLIHLRLVNEVVYTTDSLGWIAFEEPGLFGKEVYFHIEGPNYEFPADGFGFRGLKLVPQPGKTTTIKVNRLHPAERICRLTGQGIFRDSHLLQRENIPPISEATLGQDSVQAVVYRKKLFWLWGDTNLANYPLGNFQTTAATSPLPDPTSNEVVRSVSYSYFMDPENPQRVRRMMPHTEPGVVWLFGLLTVQEKDSEILLAHFTRRKSLEEQREQGLVQFDDTTGVFKKIETFNLNETWRFPRNNAFRVQNKEGDFYYFAAPLALTRVPATLRSVRDPSAYEALRYDEEKKEYQWQRLQPPTTQEDERKLIASGKLPKELARYQLREAKSKELISIHTASIMYSEYRKKWILIALQYGTNKSPSHLGEVWYSESDSPTGPWSNAIKIASHPKYSFYNPRIHEFMTQDNGKIIYFEGTYTQTFSGNTKPVPRYEYNQLLYRLDLSNPFLVPGQK